MRKIARKICKLSFFIILTFICIYLFIYFFLTCVFLIFLFRSVRLENLCALCKSGGKLISCDTCPNHYHLECLEPPLSRAPRGRWSCSKCKPRRRNVTKGNGRDLKNLVLPLSIIIENFSNLLPLEVVER